MGKVAILCVMSFLVIGATRDSQQHGMRLSTEQRDAESRYEMLARHSALYGNERGKQGLAGSFSAAEYTGSFSSVGYTSRVTILADTAIVRTTGSITDAQGNVIRYMISSKLGRGRVTPSLPPFMRYAAITDRNFQVQTAARMDTVRLLGQTTRSPNADLHANGHIQIQGTSSLFRGFGTYVQQAHIDNQSVFLPYNPTSLPKVTKVAAISIPDFEARDVAAALGPNRTTAGNVTLSGIYDFITLGATREDPYVWYVRGNLQTSGNVTLNGYVIFVAEGKVEFGHNVTAAPGVVNGLGESRAAFYAEGNTHLQGTGTQIYGQFFGDNVELSGSTRLYGSAVARGNLKLSDTANLYYIGASSALTGPWNEFTGSSLYRIAYSEGW